MRSRGMASRTRGRPWHTKMPPSPKERKRGGPCQVFRSLGIIGIGLGLLYSFASPWLRLQYILSSSSHSGGIHKVARSQSISNVSSTDIVKLPL